MYERFLKFKRDSIFSKNHRSDYYYYYRKYLILNNIFAKGIKYNIFPLLLALEVE